MNRISFNIGKFTIGNNNSCLIQTMSDRKTTDVEYNVKLTNELEKMGNQLMRFSVLDKNDAIALKKIKENTNSPIIADIHYSTDLALLAMDSGIDKIRINPGNTTSRSGLLNVIHRAKEKDITIRIGLNQGSINTYKGKGRDHIDDMFFALDETLKIFEDESFEKIVISLKTSNTKKLYNIYTRAYERYKYPLHIGLTESGPLTTGLINSTIALYPLLIKGIGDTIRISLTSNRKDEVRACKEILKLSNRRNDIPTLISCPTCGRTVADMTDILNKVQVKLDNTFKNIKVAVISIKVII